MAPILLKFAHCNMSGTYKFTKQTIKDIAVHGKTILLRADFNVPLDSSGAIASDYRIIQTLPTINYLLERGCRLVIMAHLGRPVGVVNAAESLEPVYHRLQQLLPAVTIDFAADCINDQARQLCKQLQPGSIILLENLRFHPGEETNDPAFAASLKRVSQADYFVQDGFGTVHRAHASTEAIGHILPAVAGLLLEREVTTLQSAMQHPQHPLVAVVGGAKISDKIGFIERLLPLADTILIGGAMANTFLQAAGHPIGKSKSESGQADGIARIYTLAKPDQIILPVDVGVATAIEQATSRRDCFLSEVAETDYILDLGPKTQQLFDQQIAHAATVIWNGTLGYAELPQFATASAELAETLAEQHGSLLSVIGGGDTADFVLDYIDQHPKAQFSHISTGGGASLELMSGMKLPGVEVLLDK